MGMVSCQNKNIIKSYIITDNKTDINVKDEEININSEMIKLIEKQKKSCICKIKKNNSKYGTGFFCIIPFENNNNKINALITHNKVISEVDISIGKDIYFSINNNEFKYKITINKSRKVYTENKKYYITIIELKDTDNLNNISFLELDNSIKNLNQIYIIYYLNNYFQHSIDKIHFNQKLNYITFNKIGDLGCPIINLSNNKVIGINKEINENKNKNIGIFIKEPIEEFTKICEKNLSKNNEENNIFFIFKKLFNKKNDNDNDNDELDVNPYIKVLLLCLYNIEIFRQYFQNKLSVKNIKTNYLNNLSSLICKFMQDYNEKNPNRICIIKEIEKIIKEKNDNILKDINFEKIIDYFLSTLHNELNHKENKNTEFLKDDYDEQIAYHNFEKYYSQQNESLIQNLFFGIKEIITNFKCCGLKKYSFEECRYILFDSKNIKNENNNIQNLINQWENISIQKEYFCSMCHIESKDTLIQNNMFKSPQILIIIINNKEKVKIDFNIILKTKRYEYKLIIYVGGPNMENISDFNLIFNYQNNFYKIQKDNHIKVDENDINSLMLYPYVFFYEKQKEIINTEKSSSIFDNSIINKNIVKENNMETNKINKLTNMQNNDFDKSLNNKMDNIIMNDNMKYNININNEINYNMNINNINNNNNNINNINNNTFINPIINGNNTNINIINNYNPNIIYNNYNPNNEQITLYFHFSNDKELYLDVKESLYFNEVIKELHYKYSWLNNIKIDNYLFNGTKISLSKTVKENGLKDNSVIIIIEK